MMKIFIQVVLGLNELHSRNILHRDIKPENTFVNKDDNVKIGDFGTARILESSSKQANTFIGTLTYMCPEIFQSKPYGPKSDIWSLGVMLYEMCMYEPPFIHPNQLLLGPVITAGVFKPIPKYTAPDELISAIHSMLLVDPDKRPSTQDLLRLPAVKEFASTLNLLKYFPSTATPVPRNPVIVHGASTAASKNTPSAGKATPAAAEGQAAAPPKKSAAAGAGAKKKPSTGAAASSAMHGEKGAGPSPSTGAKKSVSSKKAAAAKAAPAIPVPATPHSASDATGVAGDGDDSGGGDGNGGAGPAVIQGQALTPAQALVQQVQQVLPRVVVGDANVVVLDGDEQECEDDGEGVVILGEGSGDGVEYQYIQGEDQGQVHQQGYPPVHGHGGYGGYGGHRVGGRGGGGGFGGRGGGFGHRGGRAHMRAPTPPRHMGGPGFEQGYVQVVGGGVSYGQMPVQVGYGQVPVQVPAQGYQGQGYPQIVFANGW